MLSVEGKVFLPDPFQTFLGVPSFRPLPQNFPDRMVHGGEGFLGYRVLVVVRPAPNHRVQKIDKILLFGRLVSFHQVRYFGPEGCPVGLCRLLEQFLSFPVLAEVPSEKIKTIPDMRDSGLFRGERKSSLRHEGLDLRFDLFFQKFSGGSRYNHVVRIAHHVHHSVLEVFLQKRFKTVQRHVSDPRGANPSLRGSCFGWEESSFFHETRLQPLPEDSLVHRNIGENPVVGEIVEEAFDIHLQNPFRAFLLGQNGKALLCRIRSGPPRPEAVGISIRTGFCNGVERQFVKRLHGAVLHRRNAEGTSLAVLLRYGDPPERLGPIAFAFQGQYGVRFGARV